MAIIGFGFANALWLAVACLVVAGAMDTISGIFRSAIWNETIPDHLRGRLAGVEMISWSSGPLLGDAEAGLVAALTQRARLRRRPAASPASPAPSRSPSRYRASGATTAALTGQVTPLSAANVTDVPA